MTLCSLSAGASSPSVPEQALSACSAYLWLSSSSKKVPKYGPGAWDSSLSSFFKFYCKNFSLSAICFPNHILLFSNLKFFPFLIICIKTD